MVFKLKVFGNDTNKKENPVMSSLFVVDRGIEPLCQD